MIREGVEWEKGVSDQGQLSPHSESLNGPPPACQTIVLPFFPSGHCKRRRKMWWWKRHDSGKKEEEDERNERCIRVID